MGFDTSEEFRAILAIYEIRGVVEFTIRLSSNKLEYDLALFYTTAMQKKTTCRFGSAAFSWPGRGYQRRRERRNTSISYEKERLETHPNEDERINE